MATPRADILPLLEAELDAIFTLDRSVSPPALLAPDLHAVQAVHALHHHHPCASVLALSPSLIAAGYHERLRPEETPSPPPLSSHESCGGGGGGGGDDEEPPSSIARLRLSLGLSERCIAHGPSYVFPASFCASYARSSWPLPTDVRIITSADDIRTTAIATTAIATTATAAAVTTDEDAPPRLARPENWQPGEWTDLLAGALGPWAMAVVASDADANSHPDADADADNSKNSNHREQRSNHRGQHSNHSKPPALLTPISICFCARLTPSASEAGIWTHPSRRGQGIAPAVVAAWGFTMMMQQQQEEGGGGGAAAHGGGSSGGDGDGGTQKGKQTRTLFYSTSADNAASQAVARRLGLVPFAQIWKLLLRDEEEPAAPPRN
ncbi:hypothetical protein PCL_00928 [Purpureocillium lilacinum]|uniref:Uncharacterized protein n=1 Tax=Purpureocillium lilacinum TaxID=33203 RepID=A0A2U3E434_PURLI|nr:hypothetical protein PCL_00928 [Purpureocillium lilacinum]